MSSPAAKTFREYSEEIVSGFLQTIMVVDDLAYFEEADPIPAPKVVIAPGAPSFREKESPERHAEQSPNDQQHSTVINGDLPETEVVTDKAHKLNAKKLIDDFASKGMVCAVIRPRDAEVELLHRKVYPLAENCDIVVFDWVLYGATDGAKVKELITEITRRSSDKIKRLRLIVVYTGQEELAAI